MKVIIPLAGKGTRLRPHTYVHPKPLLHVGGRPVMSYILDDLKTLGVEEIVFLGYYYTKNGLLWVDDLQEAIDYGDAKLAQACQNAAVSCTFVDPRGAIRDRDITADGVHPNATGYDFIAGRYYDAIVQYFETIPPVVP